MRHQHASGGSGEFQLRDVRGADQTGLRRRGHVDVASPQPRCDVCRNVFVKMKANAQRSGCLLVAFLSPFRLKRRGLAAARLFRQGTLLPHLLLDFINVIEMVGKGRVNVCKSDRGRMRNDLIRGHMLMLVPRDNIEHAHTMSGDAGLPAADIRRLGDPAIGGVGHDSSIYLTDR
jgi:hypothetical protein